MKTITMGRDAELFARACLAKPQLFTQALKEKRWGDVAAVLEFVESDVPIDLAMTDPALYRMLRQQITDFNLRGANAWNLDKIRALAASTPFPSL